MKSCDVAVVGAGPCGLAAAVAAKQHGLRHEVFDKGSVTWSLVGYPWHMTFFSTAERLEIGGVPFTIPEPKPTRRDALAYYRRVVRHHGLAVRQYEKVTGIRGAAGDFVLETRTTLAGSMGKKRRVRAGAVVVATGGFGRPNRLGLAAEDDSPSPVEHWYREPYPYFDLDVIVVGGGNSAVEAALDLHRNGARVRMVHFAGVLDRGVKPWVRPDIDNRISAGDIPMHWRSRVTDYADGIATVTREGGGDSVRLPAHRILALTGWAPSHALLEQLGVRCCPRTGVPEHDQATMETNVRGVYIAGVIAAGWDANKIFIENGREHGERIAGAIAAQRGMARRAPTRDC